MTIQVFGHKNPDTDSIVSAIALAELYKENQLPGLEAVALGKLNDETDFVFNYFGEQMIPIIDKSDADSVILVDHNEFEQSVDNIADKKITHIFDHHKLNFTYDEPIFIHTEAVGSTATIIYSFYLMFGVTPSKIIAGLLASGIISDTLLLKSPTTTDFDRTFLEQLVEIAEIKDYENYGMNMLKAGTDLSNKSDSELINGDAKSFEINGKNWRIAQVNTVDIDEVLTRKDTITEEIQNEIKKDGYDDFLFVVTDIINLNSKAIFIGDDEASISKAFDQKVENSIVDLPGVASRKKQIVPPLEKA